MRNTCVAQVVALVGVAGCSAREPVQRHEVGIIDGVLDDDPELYPGVVQITSNLGFSIDLCSGTLIGSDGDRGWILTAAHCMQIPALFAPFATGLPAFTVTAGADAAQGTELPIVGAYVHPGYGLARYELAESARANPIGLVNDLALIEVSGVDETLAAAAVPILRPADDEVGVGSAGELVGFGVVQWDEPVDGRRRRATSAIEGVAETGQGVELLLVDQRGDAPGPCAGDSGGPFVVNGGDAPAVAGVISFGTGDTCEQFGVLGRVSTAAEAFVDPVVAGDQVVPAGCYACAYARTEDLSECVQEGADFIERRDFVACVEADDGSLERCREDNPVGAAVYDRVWSCLQEELCADVCTDANRAPWECRTSLDAAGTCDGCVHRSCCDAFDRCDRDETCETCLVLRGQDAAACRANEAYAAARGCLDEQCDAECARYTAELPTLEPSPPDAGPPPAGEDAEASPPDAGIAPLPSDSSGCSCRTVHPPCERAAIPWVLLTLLAWATARRSRRAPG